jgi:hypothetical protein
MTRNTETYLKLPVTPEVPLEPPPWAARSVSDEEGIAHELVSSVCPIVRWHGRDGWIQGPSNVSLTMYDVPDGMGWRRLPPVVDIEAGHYCLEGARQLRDILDGFLAAVAEGTVR